MMPGFDFVKDNVLYFLGLGQNFEIYSQKIFCFKEFYKKMQVFENKVIDSDQILRYLLNFNDLQTY